EARELPPEVLDLGLERRGSLEGGLVERGTQLGASGLALSGQTLERLRGHRVERAGRLRGRTDLRAGLLRAGQLGWQQRAEDRQDQRQHHAGERRRTHARKLTARRPGITLQRAAERARGACSRWFQGALRR